MNKFKFPLLFKGFSESDKKSDRDNKIWTNYYVQYNKKI